MFAGLSMRGLIEVIGHTDWKGTVAGEALFLVTTQPVNEAELSAKFEALTKRPMTVKVSTEELPDLDDDEVRPPILLKTITIAYASPLPEKWPVTW